MIKLINILKEIKEDIKIVLYNKGKDVGADLDFSDEDIENAPKVQIPLSKLVRYEPAIKMKSPESIKIVKRLVSKYKSGETIDPILVRKKGNKFQILDGHHRYTAAKLAGLSSINAIIVPDENITKGG
jgi:ParB family chromosome partitioning protein